MAEEFPSAAAALFAAALATETLGALTRKGTLSLSEATEILDRCLLNFETQRGSADAALIPALDLAREICESALAGFDPQRKTPPPRT